MRTGEATRAWAEQTGLLCIYRESTGSTNDDAKAAATPTAPEFCLFVASHQTAGRGRGTHRWVDGMSDHYLLSTWSYALDLPPQAITGPRAGWALFRAARRTWPELPWALKAPNDLFLGPCKVAGLLVESVSIGSSHRLIVGLGLNVAAHPGDLTDATDLQSQLGRPVEIEEWHQFLDALKQEVHDLKNEATSAELQSEVCEGLRSALNANPKLTNKVLRVSPYGDLSITGGIIHWKDL